jgi:predicted Zn-dependent peptidase
MFLLGRTNFLVAMTTFLITCIFLYAVHRFSENLNVILTDSKVMGPVSWHGLRRSFIFLDRVDTKRLIANKRSLIHQLNSIYPVYSKDGGDSIFIFAGNLSKDKTEKILLEIVKRAKKSAVLE